MKRGLNNKEKATLKTLKEMGFVVELVECISYNGTPSCYGKVESKNCMISLERPGNFIPFLNA